MRRPTPATMKLTKAMFMAPMTSLNCWVGTGMAARLKK